MVGPVSRRGLLAAAPALALAGCGQRPDAPAASDRTTQAQGDSEVLMQLVEAEEALIKVGDPGLRRDARAHRDRLRQELRRLGTTEYYTLTVEGPAREALQTAIASYIDGIPKLFHRELRVLAATILAVHAEHLAHLDGDRASEAFVVGSRA